MADYWELYKKVKAFYFSLGKLACPALNGELITFDRRGFRHMMNKDDGKRSLVDQIRRFKLLLRIKDILPSARLGKSNRDNFIRLTGHLNGKDVRIILMPLRDGQKCFVSIM